MTHLWRKCTFCFEKPFRAPFLARAAGHQISATSFLVLPAIVLFVSLVLSGGILLSNVLLLTDLLVGTHSLQFTFVTMRPFG